MIECICRTCCPPECRECSRVVDAAVAAEREACAQLAEAEMNRHKGAALSGTQVNIGAGLAGAFIADAIRARGGK